MMSSRTTALPKTLKAQDRLDEAERLYRDIVSRWPNNIVPHNGLAETLKAQDRLDEAERLYRDNVSRWPNDVFAHTGLAETLKAQDRLDEAERLYRDIVSRWPNNIVPHNGLAETLKAQDRLDEAERLYRDIVSRWPNNIVPHNGLAETLKAQDRLDEAERLYRDIVSRWPDDVFAHTGLAETLKAQDRLDEAERLYRDIVSRWPDDRVARHGLANVLRNLKRFEEALKLVPDPGMLRGNHDQYDLHLRGIVLLNSGSVDSAITLFRRALDRQLSHKQRNLFMSTLALAELKHKNYLEAIEALNTIEKTTPSVLTLRLHAVSGNNDESEARRIHSELTSNVLPFPKLKLVKEPLQRITIAYGLDLRHGLKTPTTVQLDEIIQSEIEMLLAA